MTRKKKEPVPEPNEDTLQQAQQLVTLRQSKSETEDALKKVNKEIDATTQELAIDMAYEEVPKFYLNEKGFYLSQKFYCGALPGKTKELLTWLRRRKLGHVIKVTIDMKLFRKAVQERNEQHKTKRRKKGGELLTVERELAGLARLTMVPDVRIRRRKKGVTQ
jgi:hypothetical protein